MAKTRLSPDGYGARRLSSFAGKAGTGVGAHPVGKLTRLSLDGYGVRRAGSFAGKGGATGNHPVSILTQLGLGGYGVGRYGSFFGKTPEIVVPSPVPQPTDNDSGGPMQPRRLRIRPGRKLEEEEEIMIVIAAFLQMVSAP